MNLKDRCTLLEEDVQATFQHEISVKGGGFWDPIELRDAARDHALREFIKIQQEWLEDMPFDTSLTEEELEEGYGDWLRRMVQIRKEVLGES
jgi:hypothetical protein